MSEQDFPSSSDGKESACNAGDPGSILGSGRPPGEEDGNPPQCLCLENSMDRRPWWATVYGVTKSETHIPLHMKTHIHICMKTHICTHMSETLKN